MNSSVYLHVLFLSNTCNVSVNPCNELAVKTR